MNWLDIVLIIVLIGGFLYGLRTGLIGAIFIAAGVIVGWQIAGHVADKLGAIMSRSMGADTVASFICYAIIIGLSVIVSGIALRFVRPLLATTTLGMTAVADRLGGLLLGLIIAVLLSGATIMGLVRLAYNFEIPQLPGDGITGAVTDKLRIPETVEVKEGLQEALVQSDFVDTFVKVVDKIPGDAVGFVPGDFEVSVQILKGKMEP